MPASPTRRARSRTPTSATTTRRPPSTTRSGASTSGRSARRQVRAKVAKALGGWPERPFAEALEIGSGTGYFSLNLLQLGLIGRLVATDISPGMLGELARHRRAPGARRGDRGDRRRAPAVRGRKLRPGLRPRGPASPARSRGRAGRVPPGAAARRHARLLRRALALRGPARRGAEARRPARGAALAAAARGLGATRGPGRARRRARARARGGRARLRPRDARRDAARGRLRGRPDSRRGAAGQRLRVDGPHARGNRRARARSPTAGASSPSAATSPSSASTPRCSSRGSQPSLFYNLVLSARKPATTRR